MTRTKTEKLSAALTTGRKLTANQITNRFGFLTTNSARSAISRLKNDAGLAIVAARGKDGMTRYMLA